MKKFLVVFVSVVLACLFTGCNVGEEVKVLFDVNGEPTNPWVWWVIDCKPLH